MKLKRPVFIALSCTLLGIFMISTSVKAQEKQDDTKGKPAMTKHQRDKLEWEKKRKAEKLTKAMLKAHMKHQTRAVRKRMRKDAKKAKENNE